MPNNVTSNPCFTIVRLVFLYQSFGRDLVEIPVLALYSGAYWPSFPAKADQVEAFDYDIPAVLPSVRCREHVDCGLLDDPQTNVSACVTQCCLLGLRTEVDS
jgi:hypothetical protein